MALSTQSDADASAALVRSDVLVLLREKRYEEVLARLYHARAESPDNVELQKSIDQVKEFLVGAYAKRLGGLDKVAEPVTPAPGRSPDMVLLSRYIDGTSTYGDLAEMCPLGRLRTLQVLIEMYPPAPTAGRVEESEPIASGRRPMQSAPVVAGQRENEYDDGDEMPQTERSFSSAPPTAIEDAEARVYREAFARGTAAFIQERFADAIEAFETCQRLRPDDAGAEVMLRRARRDLASR